MIDLVRELVEPSRRSLLAAMRNGPKTVGELVEVTGLKQPNVSNHLARLKAKGILRSNKVGRLVYYSFSGPEIASAAAGLLAPTEKAPAMEYSLETTRSFSKAAVAGDEQACTEIVDGLLQNGEGMVPIYSKLFSESMKMIGQWWQVQAIDEGQEHLASAIIERLMARVLHFAAPPKPGALKCVLGCSEGNWHSIGIRMLSDVLRLAGWRTFYLGANVPTPSFVASVVEHEPDVVLVSSPIDENVAEALQLIREIKSNRNGKPTPLIGAGGAALLARLEDVRAAGADFWATDLVQFTEVHLPLLNQKDWKSVREASLRA